MTENVRFTRPPMRDLHVSQLNAVRILLMIALGFGYASTMPRGPEFFEWGHHLGQDPSWFSIQVLFFLSGVMAMRSLNAGRRGFTYLISRARKTIPWLALYTGAVVILIFPLLCSPDARSLEAAPRLARYFFETVFLIDPSQRLPGLLDNSLYMCLAQGAIWTLRIGALLHIAVGIAGISSHFRNQYVIFALAAMSALAYASLLYYAAKTHTTALDTFLPLFRLGYVFAAGMAIYAWREYLPKRGIIHATILAGFLGFAVIHYYMLTWTPAIEISMTAFYAYLAYMMLEKSIPILKNWPNLVVPMFLGLWPITQIYVNAAPNLPISVLIAATILTSLLLAYLLHLAKGTIGPRKPQRDKSAFKPPDFSQA